MEIHVFLEFRRGDDRMEQMVSNVEKKAFLRWLLGRHVLKNRETVWLLNYIMSDEKLLGLIHFVDNVTQCNRAITISETRTSSSDFEYIKAKVVTNDPEKAFHDLRLNQDEAVFVKINLSTHKLYPQYFSVLEERPEMSEQVHVEYGQAAEDVLSESEKAFARERLYKAINEALDSGDTERFYKLTEKLNAMKN
ncbi:IDEAL domain-containing protein [Sporolactobacillus sp. THM7-4]|nr:IDEAL domain-containing protein [Sporolactobacillus sp. THM7-4]